MTDYRKLCETKARTSPVPDFRMLADGVRQREVNFERDDGKHYRRQKKRLNFPNDYRRPTDDSK